MSKQHNAGNLSLFIFTNFYQSIDILETRVKRISLKKNYVVLNSLSGVLNTVELLFANFIKVQPMFNFFIYKVNKNIYKNTRGKSGKYTFI